MNILDGLALHHRRRLLILFIICGIIILITSHAFKRNSPPILLVNPISDQQQSSPSSNTFACSIRAERWIVITSIFYPTAAVERFLQLSLTWSLIVVADRKTPVDWLSRLKGNRSRVLFLSMDDQYSLNFLILRHLSENSYARKNVGYLVAIQCGAKIIFESDDDNLLEANQIYHLPKVVASNDVPWIAFHRQRSLFVNIYASFGHPHIWPRGFPVDQLRNVTEDGWHSVRRNTHNQTRVYIQQYLADLDPDVDALVSLISLVHRYDIVLDSSVSPDTSIVHRSDSFRSHSVAYRSWSRNVFALQYTEYHHSCGSILGSIVADH